MVSETLAEGLGHYRIGDKVRALRNGKKLRLAELAAHTGLSPALLSRIERGQLVPTLPTLLRIAMVFGIGLEHFFVESPAPLVAVVRKSDRMRMPDATDGQPPRYYFESLDFPVHDRRMEAYLAEFTGAAGPTEPHAHDGAELVYVLAGRLAIEIGEEPPVSLDEGDSVYFDSGLPHSYRDAGTERCAAIFVVSGRGGESS